MKLFVQIAFLLFTQQAHAQILWKKTSNWKLYNINESQVFSVSIDSLGRLPSYKLFSDSVMSFINSCQQIRQKDQPVWMGGFLASYIYEGQLRKVAISTYGAFLHDQSSKLFYRLPEAKKDDWESYLNQCYRTLLGRK
jgi:hypothetical protein